MFKNIVFLAAKLATATASGSRLAVQNVVKSSVSSPLSVRSLSSALIQNIPPTKHLLQNTTIPQISQETVRTVTKFSFRKGKRKSVKGVPMRFYRLRWGGWIRTFAGRKKRMWKKSLKNKNRTRYHVFCNATQSKLLDKMAYKYWQKPRYYIDDPYEPYHSREEFRFTATKPKPYIPPEER